MNDFTVKVWGVAPDGTELISGKDAQEIITLLSSEIQAITKRNHALAAQVEVLRNAWEFVKATDWNKSLDEAFEATPQQCLREIQAVAAEKAIQAVLKLPTFTGQKGDWLIKSIAWDEVLPFAKQYATKVRQGGE